MSIWLDAIQSATSELTQVTSKASKPLGYGSDISCRLEIVDFSETDPNSKDGIAEFAVRAITTPAGSIPDAEDQGLDIRLWVNRGVTPADLQAYGGQVRGELERDDRIESAKCITTYDATQKLLTFSISLVPTDSRLAPFDLIIVLDSAGIVTLRQ